MEKSINMPFNSSTEEAVLGAVLLEKKAMPVAVQYLRAEMFYYDNHRIIFGALMRMYNARRNIDIITVVDELCRSDELEKVGGPYYITKLSSQVASSAHLQNHCLILKDLFLRRELIKGTSALLSSAQDMTMDIMDVVCNMQELVSQVENDAIKTDNLRDMELLMDDTLQQAEERMENSVNGVTGVDTGLTDLNKMTGGWQKGDLIIIAARPAVGKTMITLFLARSAAKSGLHVLFCSIEMQGERLGDRLILMESTVDPYAWRTGQTDEREWNEARQAARELATLPIKIDDNPMMSIDYIRAQARLLKSKGQCDIIFIDYLQLSEMKTPGKENRSREQEVAAAARKSKLLAKELNCPVVLLSQLNRQVENRFGNRPQLADLRESGAIEQDADIVMFLHRPAMTGQTTDKESGYPTEGLGILITAKHRNGETGNVYFSHNKSMTKIEDYVPPMEWMMRQSK
ncbi:replicative DNA helicase [uncultured Bacteroides sp.]|uniref:replicative DNA helicase n=1 Tax=uncultured Bacteroides sp. TaxID=162156 RepID=UPI002AAC094D|nr:replicative DNA helicase [uncultured Bacteroides sp.]